MTEPELTTTTAEQLLREARETARRDAVRLARDAGAPIVERPAVRGQKEPTVRDVEPLAGARAARDLELAARHTARDYMRQAREAGHDWNRIGLALGLDSGPIVP